MKTETILQTCSICEEETDNVYFCDDCGAMLCSDCVDIHLIDVGSNRFDDIQQICDVCYRERKGI